MVESSTFICGGLFSILISKYAARAVKRTNKRTKSVLIKKASSSQIYLLY